MQADGYKPLGDAIEAGEGCINFLGKALIVSLLAGSVFFAGAMCARATRTTKPEMLRQEAIDSLTPEQRKALGL